MANKKITDLVATALVNRADLFEKVDAPSGVSQKATLDQVAAAMGIAISGAAAVPGNITLNPTGTVDITDLNVVIGILLGNWIFSFTGFGTNGPFGVQADGSIFNDGWTFNDDGSGTIGAGSFQVNVAGTYTIPNLTFGPVGSKLTIVSGANQRAGNLTLVGGTKTVANTSVTANTVILLTRKTTGGTIGFAVTYTLNAGVSFTVTSDNALDTSTYSYLLIEVV